MKCFILFQKSKTPVYYKIIIAIFYLDVRKAWLVGCVGTAAKARSLSSFVADFVLFSGLLRKDLFEKKKDASREGLC